MADKIKVTEEPTQYSPRNYQGYEVDRQTAQAADGSSLRTTHSHDVNGSGFKEHELQCPSGNQLKTTEGQDVRQPGYIPAKNPAASSIPNNLLANAAAAVQRMKGNVGTWQKWFSDASEVPVPDGEKNPVVEACTQLDAAYAAYRAEQAKVTPVRDKHGKPMVVAPDAEAPMPHLLKPTPVPQPAPAAPQQGPGGGLLADNKPGRSPG